MLNFNLYLITDRHQISKQYAVGSKQLLLTPYSILLAVFEEALQAGVEAIQLREKDLSAKELFELARRMRDLTKQYGARLFINERLDIALAVEADGVHLGQNSFNPKDMRKILDSSQFTIHGSRLLIGVSTHSLDEAKKAEADKADFITIGPIFYTPSKAGYGEPLGVEVIKQVRKEIHIPVFAIGGIKEDNARDIIDAGAGGIAVISAVMGAEDVGKAARELEQSIIRVKESVGRLKFLNPNF